MPLFLDPLQTGSTGGRPSHNHLTIGLVNNMPDSACHATERQFLHLLRTASDNVPVRLRLFVIPDVPRAEHMRRELATRYHDIDQLWDWPLDGLIVTGAEPRADRLQSEPYWEALSQLVDWAHNNTTSTVWSCLAAHAAVLHIDGIVRQPLAAKLSGVFEGERLACHQFSAGIGPRWRVPHSRLNDVPESALRSCGYQLLCSSSTAGVDAFVKEEDQCSLFLFFQAHPEYEVDTLLREYRRDVGRFLRRERDNYPEMPQNYFHNAATSFADDFRTRAIADRRDDLLGDFPTQRLVAAIEHSWRTTAICIYRNWIAYLRERKQNRKTLATIAGDRWISTDLLRGKAQKPRNHA
jgi:homoserine O-succinyltransferase/O-acetyltransferase